MEKRFLIRVDFQNCLLNQGVWRENFLKHQHF